MSSGVACCFRRNKALRGIFDHNHIIDQMCDTNIVINSQNIIQQISYEFERFLTFYTTPELFNSVLNTHTARNIILWLYVQYQLNYVYLWRINH